MLGRDTALVSSGEILRSTSADGISLDPLAIAVLSEGLRAVEPTLSFTVGLKKASGATEYVRDRPHPDWAWNKWKDAVPWYRIAIYMPTCFGTFYRKCRDSGELSLINDFLKS